MPKLARWLAVGFALAMLGAQDHKPEVLSCRGSFGRFANGTLVDKPSRLNFVVDWLAPTIATAGGRPGRITALSKTELDFAVQYDGYRASYQVNRIDGSIREAGTLGSVFSGICEVKPLTTKF
jgi:hypothetical protein